MIACTICTGFGKTSKPEHQLVLLLGLILGFIAPSSIHKMEATLGAGLLETSKGGLHNATAPDECLPQEAIGWKER
jgi:hypothetical protein